MMMEPGFTLRSMAAAMALADCAGRRIACRMIPLDGEETVLVHGRQSLGLQAP